MTELLENRERDEHAVADHEEDRRERFATASEIDVAGKQRGGSDSPENQRPRPWSGFCLGHNDRRSLRGVGNHVKQASRQELARPWRLRKGSRTSPRFTFFRGAR